jgi:hypothetical protein
MPAHSINLPDVPSNSIVEAPHSRYFLCSVWQQADLTEVQNEAPSPSLCQLVNVHALGVLLAVAHLFVSM